MGNLSRTFWRTGSAVAMAIGLALAGCSSGKPTTCGGGAKACGSNADCNGFQCVNGCCGTTPICQKDSDCPTGEHCAGGTCTSSNNGSSCSSNADCASVAGATKCDLITGACVECVNPTDCGTPTKTCTANQCVTVPNACASDTDCAQSTVGPKCDLANHQCVACLGNGDCEIGQVCNSFTCVAANGACSNDTACSGSTPHCDLAQQKCVECIDNSQCTNGEVCVSDACQTSNTGCTDDTSCSGTPATPKCDTTSGKCVACLASADCNDPTMTCQNEACVAAPSGCQNDSGCSAPTPHCDTASAQCVACLQDSDCPSGDACVGNACQPKPAGCTGDGDCATQAGTPKCDTQSGKCVACLTGGDCPASGLCDPTAHTCESGCASDQYCANLAPKCDTTSHVCVACLQTSDCASGKYCKSEKCLSGCATDQDCAQSSAGKKCDTSTNSCVACLADADCAQSASGHKCLTSAHACVACLADSDCPSGDKCANNACVTNTTTDPPCGANDSCQAGTTCVPDASGAKTCRTQCDPYNPGTTCQSGKVCEWIGFDSNNAAAGACVPANGNGGAGATCQQDSDCEANLLCVPVSATVAQCAALCDPSGGTCASGDSCHALPTYYDDTSSTLLSIGVCLASTSTYADACYSDFSLKGGATTPDCGAGMTCGPETLFADPSLVVSMCKYPVGDSAPAAPCTDPATCVSGACLAGPNVCDTSCHWTSDCKRAGLQSNYLCLPYPWIAQSPYTGNVNVSDTGACMPTCVSDATCASGTFCDLTPTFANSYQYASAFYAFCYPQLGDPSGPLKKAGQPCAQDSDCESDFCWTNGTAGATDGYCFGACDASKASTECDPAGGTTCDSAGVGLLLNAGKDGQVGTSDDVYGRAYVCSGVRCESDADCAGFSADSTKARTCAPTLQVNVANTKYPGSFSGSVESVRLTCQPRTGDAQAGTVCTDASTCESGLCMALSSGSTTEYCVGGCKTDADCASGTTCQQVQMGSNPDGTPNLMNLCAP